MALFETYVENGTAFKNIVQYQYRVNYYETIVGKCESKIKIKH